MEFFCEEINADSTCQKYSPLLNPEMPFMVEMDKIDETHPLYEMLIKTHGRYNSYSMSEFLEEMYDNIFTDTETYKRFRGYIEKFRVKKDVVREQQRSRKDRDYFDFLLIHMFPFLESMSYDENKLSQNWKYIAEERFSMYHKELTKELLIIQGYMLLELHPRFHDKLKSNKNTLDNIVRDANHAYYASDANYFVSADKHTCDKTRCRCKICNRAGVSGICMERAYC